MSWSFQDHLNNKYSQAPTPTYTLSGYCENCAQVVRKPNMPVQFSCEWCPVCNELMIDMEY